MKTDRAMEFALAAQKLLSHEQDARHLGRIISFIAAHIDHIVVDGSELTAKSYITPDSPFWNMVPSSDSFRRRLYEKSLSLHKAISVARTIGYDAKDVAYSTQVPLFDVRTKLSTVNVSDDYSEIVSNRLRSILDSIVDWSLSRTAALKHARDSIARIRNETEELRSRFSRALETSEHEFVYDYTTANGEGGRRIIGSKARIDAQRRANDLNDKIEQLRLLLKAAEDDSTLMIAHQTAQIQSEYDERTRKLLDEWLHRSQSLREETDSLLRINDRLKVLRSATKTIDSIDSNVRNIVSSSIRDLTDRARELRLSNDLAETTDTNIQHRVIDALRQLAHERTGKSFLSERHLRHVAEKTYPDVTLSPHDIILEQQHEFCKQQCARLLESGLRRRRNTAAAVPVEIRANIARDTLVAFLFYFGDDTMLELIREVERRDGWSDDVKIDGDDTKIRVFRWIDWSAMKHVCYSVRNFVLTAFEKRRRYFEGTRAIT